MAVDKSLVSGSTTMLVLKLLEEKDMYGYEMIDTLRGKSKNVFELKAGTLYPLLHGLEEKGFVEAYEKEAVGKIRKYYHITRAGKKDFTPIIKHAQKLGGYEHDRSMSGINGGHMLTTGFGHSAVLSQAGKIIDAINAGHVKHIFLVGGCDGAHPGRNYYTEFVKQTPMDTLVLTLACGKYRFNDLDLGTIGGIPRLLDIGQCNDAYSAIQIALALADAFGCGVNELPLSMVLSWYEQKAVCILLTLLYLGIKNVRLGPTLPAFLSPNVLRYLVENFGIAPITTPEEDLNQLLK